MGQENKSEAVTGFVTSPSSGWPLSFALSARCDSCEFFYFISLTRSLLILLLLFCLFMSEVS